MDVTFFATPDGWRTWLAHHHDKATEQWVGFYKKDSGKPSITWPQAVDEALCFGWIDGVRKSVDAISYVIRFTPRKPNSIWSAVNIKKVAELTKLGRMEPFGIAAFEKRKAANSKVYSFEQAMVQLDEAYERTFQSTENAWQFFQSQAPSYRKAAIWWVISAKQEATRLKRLSVLISHSNAKERIPALRRPTKTNPKTP